MLGLAFFLGYEFGGSQAGRVFLGYLTAGIGLASGILLEKRERYRAFARPLIGGGWALLFFVTYAIHFVSATRVLQSEVADLVLMFGVAGGMVAHTLRYRSQVVTGFAMLLGFATVAISQSTVYSLSAGAILALSLVLIVRRLSWFELEVFGLVASYVNHYIFLRRIIEPMGGHHHSFPEFWPSTVLLISYWAIFRFSYLRRRIETPAQERISGVAALLNTSLLLALLKYQAAHPEWAFWALLALGAVESGLALLPAARRRRLAFVLLSTVGVTLLVAAFAFRYSGGRLSSVWLLESEALLLIGCLASEVVFRRLGLMATAVATGQIFISDLWPILERRLGSSAAPVREVEIGILCAIAAAAFYADAHWVRQRWASLFETAVDIFCLQSFSYVGGAMALTAIWLIWPDTGTAVGWIGLALGVNFAARRVRSPELANQTLLLAAAAFARTVMVNLDETHTPHEFSLRLWPVGVVIAGLYLLSHYGETKEFEWTRFFRHVFSWSASFLTALLAWHELPGAWVSVAWIAVGLAMTIMGRTWKRSDLALQGYSFAAAAFVRTLAVNLGESAMVHHISVRLLTVGLVAAGLYILAARSRIEEMEWTHNAPHAFSWSASFLAAMLIWFELRPISVALAWGLLGFVLFELGIRFRSLSLRLQSYVALGCAFVRLFIVNLNAVGPPGGLSPRLYTVLPLTLAFYYGYARSEGLAHDEWLSFDRRIRAADWLCYLGTISLAALLRFELQMDWVIAGWAALTFLLVAVAWNTSHRVFLHQGILLSTLILARCVLHNFYERSYFPAPFWYQRKITVGVAVAILFACVPFALRLRERLAGPAQNTVRRWERALGFHRPEQILFFIPLGLLTTLLALEMDRGLITVSWGVEGVAVFLMALVCGQRSYRISGLALLLLCVGKIVIVDVWGLNPRDRYLTFIVLGCALLLVSFLYTRYREKLAEYL